MKLSKKADNSKYANGDDIKLVNFGPIALISNFKMTKSSGKHLEDISHAHIVSLMLKLMTSSRGGDDLSIRFDRGRGSRRNEFINNRNMKANFHVKIMLKDFRNTNKKLHME